MKTCERMTTHERRTSETLLWLLEKCRGLHYLKASCLGRFGHFLRPVPRMDYMTEMEIYGLKATHRDLKDLFVNHNTGQSNFPNLVRLSLTNLRISGNPSNRWLLPFALPYLTALTVTWSETLTADMIVDIGYKLKYLSLHGCFSITDAITTRLYTVEELDLAFTGLTDKGLNALYFGCPALRKLTLAHQQDNNWRSGLYSDAGLDDFREKRPDVEVIFVHC